MAYAGAMTQGAARERGGDDGRRGLGFEGGTGFLLARAGSLARRTWARMLAERDLTPHHFGTLMTLHELGPLGQQQLSAHNGIDPRNAGPVIDGLVERNLVARTIHSADRRRRVLQLTDTGRDIVRDLAEAGDRLERHFFRGLTVAEREELHRTLLSLIAAAHDDGDAGAPGAQLSP